MQLLGVCTKADLFRFLRCHPYMIDRHMKALGIVLSIDDRCKNRYRKFTEDEAKRIIARHYAMKGRDFERGL